MMRLNRFLFSLAAGNRSLGRALEMGDLKFELSRLQFRRCNARPEQYCQALHPT